MSIRLGFLKIFFHIIEEMAHRGYLSTLELVVMLALMRLREDAYGVSIAREIEESTGRRMALASVYATLDRMESRGLVLSELGEPTLERGGRAKRYFQLTTKGLREVRQVRHELKRLWNRLPQLQGEPT